MLASPHSHPENTNPFSAHMDVKISMMPLSAEWKRAVQEDWGHVCKIATEAACRAAISGGAQIFRASEYTPAPSGQSAGIRGKLKAFARGPFMGLFGRTALEQADVTPRALGQLQLTPRLTNSHNNHGNTALVFTEKFRAALKWHGAGTPTLPTLGFDYSVNASPATSDKPATPVLTITIVPVLAAR